MSPNRKGSADLVISVQDLGVQGVGVQGVRGLGFRVSGFLGCMVLGFLVSGFLVSGFLGFEVWERFLHFGEGQRSCVGAQSALA